MKIKMIDNKTLKIFSESYEENLALESWSKRYTPFLLQVISNNCIPAPLVQIEDETSLVIENYHEQK